MYIRKLFALMATSLILGQACAYEADEVITFSNTSVSSGNCNYDYASPKIAIPSSASLDADLPVIVKSIANGVDSTSSTVGSTTYTPATTYTISGIGGDGTSSEATITASGITIGSTSYKKYEYTFASPVALLVGTSHDFASTPTSLRCIATTSADNRVITGISATSDTYHPAAIVSVAYPAVATIASDVNWSALSWNSSTVGYAPTSTSAVYLHVTANATLTIGSSTTVGALVLNVDDGVTLTLSGSALTATGGVRITGDGMVSIPGASSLSGTLSGDGTLIINSFTTQGTPSVASSWTGTVWLKGTYSSANNDTRIANFDPSAYGTASSTVKLTGIKCYFKNAEITYNGILELEDDGDTPALHVNDAYSILDTFKTLKGSGTLKITDQKTAVNKILFKDASAFTGTFNIATRSVAIGSAPSSWSNDGQIYVASGATASIAASKAWVASAGIVVNGTLMVESGATAPAIKTGATASYMLSSSGTISTVSSGTLAASLFVTSGTLTVADTTKTTITMPAELSGTYYNGGTIDFTGCTALTSLILDLGSAKSTTLGTVNVPVGCNIYVKAGALRDLDGYTNTTYPYLIEETKAEYALGSLEVSNVPAGASVYVKAIDGTIAAATVDGTTATYGDGTIRISGAATLFDINFTGKYTVDYPASGVSCTPEHTGETVAGSLYNNTDNDKTTGMYLRHTPYMTGVGNLIANNSGALTVVTAGVMPTTAGTIFLHVGRSVGSEVGLLFVTGSGSDVGKVVIAYHKGTTVTPITTISVPNATTTRHVYAVTKEDGDNKSTFTVYLDGIKWKTLSIDQMNFSSSSGVQVGSDHGGQIKSLAAYDSAYTADDTNGYVCFIRFFDSVLDEKVIKYFSDSSEYPYVSPSGSAVRTFTAASEDWIDGTEDSEVWENTTAAGVTTQSGTPAVGAAVTVNADVATTISVNLDDNTSYEAITINGTGATFEQASGSEGTINVGSSVIGAPVTIKPGALNITGGPVTMTEDGSLSFDYSDYVMTSASVIELTGEMERNDAKVSITVPSDQHYTYTSGYSGTQYVITPSVAVAVLNHNGTLTGYTTIAAAVADAVSGDTITLQTTDLTPSTLLYTAEGVNKSGVTFIVHGVEVAAVHADSNTTWTTDAYYHWTGEGANNNWTTSANWGLTSGCPGASDTACFDSATEVTLTANQPIGGLVLNANLTLSGSSTYGLNSLTSITGTGSLILNNSGIENYSRQDLDFSNPVDIAGDGINWLKGNGYYTSSKDYASHIIKVRGNLSGNGYVEFRQGGIFASGVQLYGNNSSFYGHVNVIITSLNNTSRHSAIFGALSAGSENATWEFSGATANNKSGNMLPNETGTIKLGRLIGRMVLWRNSSSPAINVEIGGAGTSETCDVIEPLATANDGAWRKSNVTITKVGAGTLEVNGPGNDWRTCVLHYVAKEGKLKFTGYALKNYDNNGVQYADIAFSGGTVTYDNTIVAPAALDISSKIIAGTCAVNIEIPSSMEASWATALSNSNAPYGLTKRGEGSLTLTAVPTYTGETVVEAGRLVLPSGTTLSGAVSLTGGTLEVPVGTTFGSTVSVSGTGKIQVVGDSTWADASNQTLVTFTDSSLFADKTDEELKAIFEITGLGPRQTYTLDASTGSLVATITTPVLTWNGADGANWTDANVWLVGETPTSYISGDQVAFQDSLFTGETSELTVNIPVDINPAVVTIASGEGHTYNFTGAGKVTGDIAISVTGSGTASLKNDVFSGLDIEIAGTFEIDADEGEVTLGAVSGAGTLKVSTGTLNANGAITSAMVDNATVIFATTDYTIASSISGSGKIVVDGVNIYGNNKTSATNYSYCNEFSGEVELTNGAYLYLYKDDALGSSALISLNGGTISEGVNSGSFTVPNPINIDGTGNSIRNDMTSNNKSYIRLNGNLTGTGEVLFVDSTATSGSKGIYLGGDNSNFAGTFTFFTRGNTYQTDTPEANKGNNASGFRTASAGSSEAIWNVYEGSKYLGIFGGGTHNLGALNVPAGLTYGVCIKTAGTVVNIGNKAGSSIASVFYNNTATINKVGSSTLSLGSAFSMVSGSTINVNEGKLVTATNLALTDVDVTFADGVKMGVTGVTTTDNVQLFTTTGTVTLNGKQFVDTDYEGEGEWVLKTSSETVEEVTTTTVYAQFCELIKSGDDEVGYMDGTTAVITDAGSTVTVPAEGVSRVAVPVKAASGEATIVSAGTMLTTDNVAVYATDENGKPKFDTDITGAFKVTAGANNTYTVELDGDAIVGTTKVKPEVDATDEEPIEMGNDGTPTFAVKAIDGLWYAVEAADSPEGFASATLGTPVQGAGGSASPVAPAFSGNVKYYKIAVGASKAALTAAE